MPSPSMLAEQIIGGTFALPCFPQWLLANAMIDQALAAGATFALMGSFGSQADHSHRFARTAIEISGRSPSIAAWRPERSGARHPARFHFQRHTLYLRRLDSYECRGYRYPGRSQRADQGSLSWASADQRHKETHQDRQWPVEFAHPATDSTGSRSRWQRADPLERAGKDLNGYSPERVHQPDW